MADRKCFPKSRIWLTQILPGSALAVAGLIIYCGFETEANYYYTHSLWHIIMALAIIFLLPRTEKLDWKSTLSFLRSFKDIRRRQTGIDNINNIDNSEALIVTQSQGESSSVVHPTPPTSSSDSS